MARDCDYHHNTHVGLALVVQTPLIEWYMRKSMLTTNLHEIWRRCVPDCSAGHYIRAKDSQQISVKTQPPPFEHSYQKLKCEKDLNLPQFKYGTKSIKTILLACQMSQVVTQMDVQQPPGEFNKKIIDHIPRIVAFLVCLVRQNVSAIR